MMIYVEVIAKWPTFAEITKNYDLLNGPTGGGNPMSHQEFLNMVTPKEMYGSGGISAPEVLTMALVNYFGKKAITKGLKEIGETRDQKKIAEIRARIDAELARSSEAADDAVPRRNHDRHGAFGSRLTRQPDQRPRADFQILIAKYFHPLRFVRLDRRELFAPPMTPTSTCRMTPRGTRRELGPRSGCSADPCCDTRACRTAPPSRDPAPESR
jgi:hypothetical protein